MFKPWIKTVNCHVGKILPDGNKPCNQWISNYCLNEQYSLLQQSDLLVKWLILLCLIYSFPTVHVSNLFTLGLNTTWYYNSITLEVIFLETIAMPLHNGKKKGGGVSRYHSLYFNLHKKLWLPRSSGKEPACQCRRHKRCRLNPWVGKIPWRRAWQPTPVFSPGEFHGQRSLVATAHRAVQSLTRLKWLSTHAQEIRDIE